MENNLNTDCIRKHVDLVCIYGHFKGKEVSFVPPSGLLYVGGALRKAGYDVAIHHISSKEISVTARKIASRNPIYVGISVFTGLPAVLAAKISKEIKQLNKELPIVWGGVHPSLSPSECLNQAYVDIVVIGEGEITAVELADNMINSISLNTVNGIGFKSSGQHIITNVRKFIENLDEYNMDWELVDVEKYIQKTADGKRTFVFITSRGCPFPCGFCYNVRFNKNKWRAHSDEFVISQVSKLKESYKFTHIVCNDDNFFCNKNRALRIIKGFYELGIKIVFAELRVDSITDELLTELEKYEVEHVFFGWESGTNRILDLIQKNISVENILDAVTIFRKHPNLSLKASAIIAFPMETKQEIWNTVDLALKMGEIHKNIHFNLGIYLPYPGTTLYDLAIKEGFTPPVSPEGWKYWDMFSKKISLTWLPWITKKDISDIRNINKYFMIYYETPRKNNELRLKYILKKVFRDIAKYRLKNRFFCCQIELYVFALLSKINAGVNKLKISLRAKSNV